MGEMARELSATLEEQQKWGLISWPVIQARIVKKWGDVIRYDFEVLHENWGADCAHTAVMPSDGSLIRLKRNNWGSGSGGGYQRITDPDQASDYASWDDPGATAVTGVASCSNGSEVNQFYARESGDIYHRQSNDNGENWGAWTNIDNAVGTYIEIMDAAQKSNGDISLIYLDANELYIMQRLSGVWQAREANPNTLGNKTGASIYYHEDWNIVIPFGPPSGVKGLIVCIYGDGERQALETWSDWEFIFTRSATDPFVYTECCVRRSDTTRLYFREQSTQEEETKYIFYSQMPPSAHFDDLMWLEPIPMQPRDDERVSFTLAGSYAWLTNTNHVYRALATEDALVLTARLLEVDSRDYPDIYKGSLKVVIDNTGGWYNDFDRLGQQLEVRIGYKTPAGDEYSLVPCRWVTKFKLIAPPWYPLRMIYPSGITGTLKIETEDAWTFLYRYRTRRTLSWEADEKSVKELLQFFIARCGLDFDVISQSDAVQNFKPAFTVNSGTSYRTAIKRLLKMVPDQLVFREAKVLLRNPTTEEAVDWTYHTTFGTALLVFRGKYGKTAQDPNRAEVWGDTFTKIAGNWPQIQMVRDRLSRVTSPDYPDLTRAGERAEAELRRAEILTGGESEMNAPVNCGLEPWDIVQITDINAGVNAIRRRVLRIKSYWNARHWSYQQVIKLGDD